MNTASITPQNTSVLPAAGVGETMIIAFIMAMPGWDVSMCMAVPVRRCFTLALGCPVTVIPHLDGILIQISTRDTPRGLNLVRAELAALNYLPLAHVGWLNAGEWHCFHGSADLVSDFTKRLHAAVNQLESQNQIVRAYHHAVHGFTLPGQ